MFRLSSLRSTAIGLASAVVALGTACLGSPTDPGALVPPTAYQDPALPQLSLQIAGRQRALHLETFGRPGAMVMLLTHGAGGGDYRAMLPLRALADQYFMVFWDGLGSGLSERAEADAFTNDSRIEEVRAIKQLFSPNSPVILVGYSHGGLHLAQYASQHPEDVWTLILLEPAPLSFQARQSLPGLQLSWFAPVLHEHLWQLDILGPGNHEQLDYKIAAALRRATSNLWCEPERPGIYSMWRAGAIARMRTGDMFADASGYSFTPGLVALPVPVLFVGSSCGPLRADWQQEHHLPLFGAGRLIQVPGGHLDFIDHNLALRLGMWLRTGQ